MRIIRRPNPEQPLPECALTIGNFDGVHLGHQALLAQLAERARGSGISTTVITFEPLPREFFMQGAAPVRLMELREKVAAMSGLGVDTLCVLPFDRSLSQMTAEAFVGDILVSQLQARHVLIGHDFRFGRERRGDIELLGMLSAAHGFSVDEMPAFEMSDKRVSSTRIREALLRHDLDAARSMLGRPYQVCGRVIGGKQLGRRLGFATANISLARRDVPIAGVFAVAVSLENQGPIAGVANLGTRPALGGTEPLLEVHLFDFDQDLYGQRLAVEFLHYLRPERNFADMDALRAQMREDAREARRLLDRDAVPFYGQA